jgi:hypothetical protein
MESSTRYNNKKLDLTNLTPIALLPHQCAEHMLIEGILYYIEQKNYQLPLKLFAESYPNVIEIAARVMKHGEKVYGYDNWKKGMSRRSILQSLYRHIHAYCNQGEIHDRDSGYSHLGHIYCNLMFLEYHSRKGFLTSATS